MDAAILFVLLFLITSAESEKALSCPEGWDWPGLHNDQCYQWAGDFDINDWRDSVQVWMDKMFFFSSNIAGLIFAELQKFGRVHG